MKPCVIQGLYRNCKARSPSRLWRGKAFRVEAIFFMEKEGRLLQFRPRETVGSVAFDTDKEKVYSNAQMRTDTISYISEYRLRVQKYDYEFQFSFVEGEGYKLRDIHSGEAMSIKTKHTLEERRVKGLSIYRELAEDAGIENLDEQLLYAQDGDRIFWMSPPGSKEDGYGDYGFMFEGRIVGERILMTANRVENPTIVQFNRALLELTGDNVGYINPEGFLANPRVVKNNNVDIDAVLQKNFSFMVDQKEALINKQVITEMDSMIDEFVGLIRSGSREERITAFHALENYALELKKSITHKAEAAENDNIIFMSDHREHRYLTDILPLYGFRPPVVGGSCGSTGEDTKSSDLFADNYKDLMKAIFGDFKEMFGVDDNEWYTCPKCPYKASGPINGTTCPGCGLTQEQYAKETGQSVCA